MSKYLNNIMLIGDLYNRGIVGDKVILEMLDKLILYKQANKDNLNKISQFSVKAAIYLMNKIGFC